MSNCVVAVAEWPIVRSASGLTLRAPALRAATALTRLARWASGLSCGRRDVPADRAVDPRCIVTKHGIEDGDDLAHDGDEDDLDFLSSGRQAVVESSEFGIATAGNQRWREGCAIGGRGRLTVNPDRGALDCSGRTGSRLL
jgi:hypothetical protein